MERRGLEQVIGGVTALQLSLGEIVIGTIQLIEAIVKEQPEVPQAGSLPGFVLEGVAKQTGNKTLEKAVPFVDVGVGLGTSTITKGLKETLIPKETLGKAERAKDVYDIYEATQQLQE